MWPLKWWRIRKAEIAADNAVKEFVKHAGVSASRQHYFKNLIVTEMHYIGSWDKAILDPEISSRAYEQFLHCQFMGYLAEEVRMTRYKVRLLKSQPTESMWRLGEDLGDAVADNVQGEIYKEYLVGLRLEINAIENGRTRHPSPD